MNAQLEKLIDAASVKLKERYENILNTYYPAHGANGFTERNLTNNFIAALESVSKENIISWYEAPISEKQHLDAVVLSQEMQLALLIESKRFANPTSAKNAIFEDIERISNPANRKKVLKGYFGAKPSNIYGLILADVWKENPTKEDIFNNWPIVIAEKTKVVKSWKISFKATGNMDECINKYAILIALIKPRITDR